MKHLKISLTVAAAAMLLLLPGTAFAQAQSGADIANMSQQDFENWLRQSTPEQRQAARGQFFQMNPQQQQSMMRMFFSADPQLRQSVMQEDAAQQGLGQQNVAQALQGIDPERIQEAMQQRLNDSLRTQMGITNDDEWTVIEEKINAVRKAQRIVLADSGTTEMMGLSGMGGQRPGRIGLQALLGKPGPESSALRQALESGAPETQLKTLAAKLKNVRKDELTKLARAQEELRSLLKIRQEAVATMAGLLD
jgi:hypothetical protein